MGLNPTAPSPPPLMIPTDSFPENPQVQSLFVKLIQDVNDRISEGIHSNELLDFVFDALALLIPYDRIGVAIISEDRESVELTWVRSKAPIHNIRQTYSVPLKGSSLNQILETGKPRLINDLVQFSKEHPESQNTKLIIKDGVRANLTCPLKSHGEIFGFVFFSSLTPHVFDESHLAIFKSIASELSVVLDQNRLHEYFLLARNRDRTTRMLIHDLRTPLAVIQGYVEEISNRPWYNDLSSEGKEVFSLLHRNTTYMVGLLNELSDLIQIDSDSHFLMISEVNIAEFCSEMSLYGKLMAEKKEIEFQAIIDPNIPTEFNFDSLQIRRVLDNLFSNAIKFSRRHTVITFEVTFKDQRLSFKVKDQGLGIPDSEKPKLFQEFGRTKVYPTEGERTTGLGLAIAKRIIEKHHGAIAVQSEVDVGSTFSFWLPELAVTRH